MEWFRIDKSNGDFKSVDVERVRRMADEWYSEVAAESVMSTGEFQTPYAIYYREDRLRISCGCCRGLPEDRCICHMHQDTPRGRAPRICSRHAKVPHATA